MKRTPITRVVLTALAWAALTAGAYSQPRIRHDSLVPVPLPASNPTYGGAPATTLSPGFDPYSSDANAAGTRPSLLGAPNTTPGAAASPSWQSPTNPGASGPVFPGGAANGGMVYPQQPPVLFPGGIKWPTPGWPQATPGQYLRLFQDTRMQYTWLDGGNDPREMQTHDVEVATTFNVPNFLWSGRPLHTSPVFVFHFWDGPDSNPMPPAPLPGTFPTELPSRVYSTYLNFRWQPMLTPMFGGDLDVNVGVFSDFDTVRNDSIRLFGTGLARLALTPTVTIKAGVAYLDRVDLKLLPAAGIVWTPNPQTRFDVFFPKPKLAQFLTTVGNTDVWWYVNAEYGGGSWTIDRAVIVPGPPPPMPPSSTFAPLTGDPRMDINDIRVGGGLEWTGYGGVRGFVEAAYVFDREIVFVSGPIGRHSLKDTVMVRGGLAY